MFLFPKLVVFGWIFAVLMGAPQPARAVTISFAVEDLPDVLPSQDLWQYTYYVSNFAYPSDYGFAVRFDPTVVASIDESPANPSADWDVITFQPDTNLPADGIYDALALQSSPSVSAPFTVSFVRIGTAVPGSQTFEAYDAFFATVESGLTFPVPEPGTLALVLVGLTGIGIARRRTDAP